MREVNKKLIKSEMKILLQAITDLCDKSVWKLVFICSFVVGFVVHFVIISDYYVNHDSIVLVTNFGGWLLSQGKWFVTPVTSLEGEFDIPYLASVIGLVAYSISGVIICILFHVQNKLHRIIIGIVLVTFPSVATMQLYHAVDYFGTTFLLAVLSAYMITKKGFFCNIIGIIIGVFSIGAYQAYVGVIITLLVMKCIISCVCNDDTKNIVIDGLKYVIESVFSIIIYYIILQVKLRNNGVELSSYKGINNMTDNLRIDVLLNSTKIAYLDFINFFLHDNFGIYEKKCNLAYIALFVLIPIVTICCLYFSKALWKVEKLILTIALIVVCFPISSNIIGVLAANTSYYYISIAPFVLVFVLLVVLIDHLCNILKTNNFDKWKKYIIKPIITVFAFFLCFNWIVQVNTVYHKVMLINKSFDAKFNVLMAQIQCFDDYSGEKEIVFVGKTPYTFLKTAGMLESFDEIYDMSAYGMGKSNGEIYSAGILQAYIKNKFSYNVQFGSQDEISESYFEELQEMNEYPNAGSMKVIDDKVIVKLSNEL